MAKKVTLRSVTIRLPSSIIKEVDKFVEVDGIKKMSKQSFWTLAANSYIKANKKK